MYILASASPRRTELLSKVNFNHTVVVKDIEEVFPRVGTSGDKLAKVALDKAIAVFIDYPNDVVIGADTGVVLNDEILGKPKDDDHALEMLLKLNGSTHKVITGVAIVSKDCVKNFYVETTVVFKTKTIEEIKEYIATEEPRGKAGAYAIQGIGAMLVDSYDGDLDNIIGLPVTRLLEELNVTSK